MPTPFDFATLPWWAYADYLEEQGESVESLRLWAEHGCFSCSSLDSWWVRRGCGQSLAGHCGIESEAVGDGRDPRNGPEGYRGDTQFICQHQDGLFMGDGFGYEDGQNYD